MRAINAAVSCAIAPGRASVEAAEEIAAAMRVTTEKMTVRCQPNSAAAEAHGLYGLYNPHTKY